MVIHSLIDRITSKIDLIVITPFTPIITIKGTIEKKNTLLELGERRIVVLKCRSSRNIMNVDLHNERRDGKEKPVKRTVDNAGRDEH
jgi:hypothetical protein